MGLLARIVGVGCVVAVAAALGLHVAPLESSAVSAVRFALAPVLSADALPPRNAKTLAARTQPEVHLTALAAPRMKPVFERAALIVPPAPKEALGLSGDERPAPSGYLEFCKRRPDICSVGGAWQVALSDASWDQLVSINTHFDDAIEPQTDMEALGVIEHWDIPAGRNPVGDCEDFALAKKAELIAKGWPRSALLLAVANIPGADVASRRHAVLIVVTDQGNFVLDNRRLKILRWDEAGYEWVSIQSPANAYKWVAINQDATSGLVTASGVPDITRARQ